MFSFLHLFFLLSAPPAGDNASLHIQLDGAGTKGRFYVALYRKTDDFPSEKKAFKQIVQQAGNSEIKIENLPKNTYAVAVYHDENSNGKMDKNMFGVPTEKYGFSNNARGTFSAPSFSEAAFELQKDREIRITIK